MVNYTSLRGPVCLNRVYVPASGVVTPETFVGQVKRGRGTATNGAPLQLSVGEAIPGVTVHLTNGTHFLTYRATLQANFPVDHLELIWNGAVIGPLQPGQDRRFANVKSVITVSESGRLLLRARSDGPHPNVLDIYRWATTSPVYLQVGDKPRRLRDAAPYSLRWLDRLQTVTGQNTSYRTTAERRAVLQDIGRARAFYEQVQREAAGASR